MLTGKSRAALEAFGEFRRVHVANMPHTGIILASPNFQVACRGKSGSCDCILVVYLLSCCSSLYSHGGGIIGFYHGLAILMLVHQCHHNDVHYHTKARAYRAALTGHT